MSKPFLRWVGGKTKLLPELLKRLPDDIAQRRYFEPFLGGGALFFSLRSDSFDCVLSDVNEDLIVAYRSVRDDLPAVLSALQHFEGMHDGDHYYKVRDCYNGMRHGWPMHLRAAAFIYLNKTCFNGVHRVNRQGHFNVPLGSQVSPKIRDVEALTQASAALQSVGVFHAPFDVQLSACGEGDFAYLDPPYEPMSDTANFASYAKDGFGRTAQLELREQCREITRRGGLFMLSNSDTSFTRELYAEWQIDSVNAPRSINSNTAKRGKVGEIIVRNYGAPALEAAV